MIWLPARLWRNLLQNSNIRNTTQVGLLLKTFQGSSKLWSFTGTLPSKHQHHTFSFHLYTEWSVDRQMDRDKHLLFLNCFIFVWQTHDFNLEVFLLFNVNYRHFVYSILPDVWWKTCRSSTIVSAEFCAFLNCTTITTFAVWSVHIDQLFYHYALKYKHLLMHFRYNNISQFSED